MNFAWRISPAGKGGRPAGRRVPWPWLLASAVTVAALGGGVLAWRALFTRLEIDGVSMLPTFAPGDRVLVRKTRQVAVGDAVALRDPDSDERYLVKRVVGLEHGAVRVEGDNIGASRDSRHFGLVPENLIVGRVVTTYGSRRHPAGDGSPWPSASGS